MRTWRFIVWPYPSGIVGEVMGFIEADTRSRAKLEVLLRGREQGYLVNFRDIRLLDSQPSGDEFVMSSRWIPRRRRVDA